MNNPIPRAHALLFKPQETWPVIAQENSDAFTLYRNWVMWLALIPAICSWLGLSLVGMSAGGLTFRLPLLQGLFQAVVGYGMSLAIVAALAWIIHLLSPSFGGSGSRMDALKVAAYGCTAMWVAGVFYLVPSLSVLAWVGLAYSIYLIYLGLPLLMKCPTDKALAYTLVASVGALVVAIVLSFVLALLAPFGGMSGLLGAQLARQHMPNASSAPVDLAKQLEKAQKSIEAAQDASDIASASKDVGDAVNDLLNLGKTAAIPSDQLKSLLPEAIDDLRRTSIDVSGGSALGLGGSTAKAIYEAGERQLKLSITDAGGLAGLAAVANWAKLTVDRETNTQVEKVFKQGGRTIRQDFLKDGSRSELTVLLPNGVIVQAQGRKIDMPTLEKTIESMVLNKLEAMKPVANKAQP